MTDEIQWNYTDSLSYPDSLHDLMKVYDKWAPTYDIDVNGQLKGIGSKNLIKHALEFITNEESCLMLDVPAGTGRTAVHYKELGYNGKMDALEMNQAMMDVAKAKGLYRKTFIHTCTETDPLPVPDNSYDIVSSDAGLFLNHMPQGCIPHLVNAAKRGGIIIFNSRTSPENERYLETLQNVVDELVGKGTVVLKRKVEVPYGLHIMSYVFVLKKL